MAFLGQCLWGWGHSWSYATNELHL